YRRDGEKMPLAAVLGGDPAVLLAASVRLAPEVEACVLAGLLRERPIDVVPCRTVQLLVPAEAEIVIEGYVDPAEPPVQAGPMTGPSGHYCLGRRGAVMHVTALTHRANPIFPAAVPDDPPHELCTISRALTCIFKPLVNMAIPEMVDCDLPMFGAGRHWATVSIRKTYAGQARRVAHAAWGLEAL
ncbi:MAG: menaquinone biosynthesis decarboxylase, partial [Planctomycetales bacterium]|nr:menaquinone biosynthesis decarboxylase [Planctomycetales bacterium]